MNIEQGLRVENENLKRLLEETERERDEALAYGERLHGALNMQLAVSGGIEDGGAVYSNSLAALSKQPPAALAALKADLQAEAASEVIMILIRGYIFHQPKWFPHFREEVRSKFMRAQEAGDE